MTFRRVSRDEGIAVLGRLLDRARIIAVLSVLLAMLAPTLATSGVATVHKPSSCHELGIDLPLPSAANGDATPCGVPVDAACGTAACAMSACVAVSLPARLAVPGLDDALLAVSFDGGDRPAAGIGASPGLRPPIPAIAV